MRRRTFAAAVLIALVGRSAAAQSWQQAILSEPVYDDETHDYGLPPTATIRTGNYDAPTPTRVVGATTITTPQLRDMMLKAPTLTLIDVLGGNQTVSLPGAIWLPEAGQGTGLDDPLQQRLAARLVQLTGGDKAKAMAFFCLSKTCWLSHNSTVRAVSLGYANVYWYRGGRNAWKAAGLALEPVKSREL